MEDRRNPCRDLGQDRKSGFIQIPNRTLLRQSSRQGKKVIKRTLANLSSWPEPLVEGLRTLLKGGTAVENLAESFEKVRSLPHGHVGHAAPTRSAGPTFSQAWPGERQLVAAMVVARILDHGVAGATDRQTAGSGPSAAFAL